MSSINKSPTLENTGFGANAPVGVRIGRRIKKRRQELGMTQLDLSEELGLNVCMVQRYERGSAPIPVDRLCNIASALKVPAGHLLDGTDQRCSGQTKTVLAKAAPQESQKPEKAGSWIKGGGIVQGVFSVARRIADAVNDN